MKQFQVIEKDGQKWLRTYHPDEVIYGEPRRYTLLPYIGVHPVGALVDESKVREVRQHKLGGKWHITTSDLTDTSFSDYWELETRTAYTDVEQSHDLTLKAAMPLIKLAADEMRESSYWQKRCEAAEKLIGIFPSDPKSYPEFCRLREEWETIKNEKQ